MTSFKVYLFLDLRLTLSLTDTEAHSVGVTATVKKQGSNVGALLDSLKVTLSSFLCVVRLLIW
jgi:hypothetical protein